MVDYYNRAPGNLLLDLKYTEMCLHVCPFAAIITVKWTIHIFVLLGGDTDGQLLISTY